MFAINHASAALVLKHRYPTVRMVFLLVSVQAVELIWVALNLLGVEVTTTDDTVRSLQNIHLLHMPWSHSIATTLALAIAAWALIRIVLGRPRIAVAVALGIASHLLLDLVTHNPDIAIVPGLTMQKLGTGLYGSFPLLAFLLELGLGIVCWRIYRGSRWLLLAIMAFNIANVSMFLPQVAGLEAKLAGQPTTLALIILVQIVITLAVVGWLSRDREDPRASVFPSSQDDLRDSGIETIRMRMNDGNSRDVLRGRFLTRRRRDERSGGNRAGTIPCEPVVTAKTTKSGATAKYHGQPRARPIRRDKRNGTYQTEPTSGPRNSTP